MTATATDLLLEARDVSKRYGAVVALRSASLAVRPGEVHALMGANGAGKSTLVKILTGTVDPDGGTISVRGRERAIHSPVEARRGGLVSVYQEPSLIPDLDIESNLRLTETPQAPFRDWLRELGLERLDQSKTARRLPLATLRVIDLARALAVEPDVLMLDEMTAALPANLTERVLEVVGRQRGGDRCVVFISHRMSEIAAVCDRATVLREGQTVGVVDVTSRGSAERIVELMLGEILEDLPADGGETAQRAARSRQETPRIAVSGLGSVTKLQDVSFDLHAGEVLGVVALEGQGQDELFDVLSGSVRPSAGDLRVDGKAASFSHPADAIRAGIVYVAADRAEALLPQRSVRENIALPFSARIPNWGVINVRNERRKVDGAITRLQIDTRAQREVRRLSGGNQQKVTIARWVAVGLRTMLCFDPTRGIDIRTKHQIYILLRDLAEAGAAILLYTSELNEIQIACDRAIVIFGGRVVAEIDAAEADEEALLRAAHNLPPDAPTPEEVAAEVIAAEAAEAATEVAAETAPEPPGAEDQ
ncbi:MAG: sugar ABC transporter ATP-binding protein [Candidatus Limnocylindria bacterium]